MDEPDTIPAPALDDDLKPIKSLEENPMCALGYFQKALEDYFESQGGVWDREADLLVALDRLRRAISFERRLRR